MGSLTQLLIQQTSMYEVTPWPALPTTRVGQHPCVNQLTDTVQSQAIKAASLESFSVTDPQPTSSKCQPASP